MTCDCGKNASFRRATPKHLVSTVGAMDVTRRYYACRACGRTFTPWDDWIKRLARKATVMIGAG